MQKARQAEPRMLQDAPCAEFFEPSEKNPQDSDNFDFQTAIFVMPYDAINQNDVRPIENDLESDQMVRNACFDNLQYNSEQIVHPDDNEHNGDINPDIEENNIGSCDVISAANPETEPSCSTQYNVTESRKKPRKSKKKKKNSGKL